MASIAQAIQAEQLTPLDELRRLTQKQVREITGLSRTQLYALRRADRFPKPVYLAGNERLLRWRLVDIRAWLERESKPAPDPLVPIVDRRRRAAKKA